MEVKYVPFLKGKQNEIHAISDLERDILLKICPFFDYPKKQKGDNSVDIGPAITRLARKFKKHLGHLCEFYFDIYDLDEDLEIGDRHLYEFLLQEFAGLPLVPVVSIDRSNAHQESVVRAMSSSHISSRSVAFRVTPVDFQSFDAIFEEVNEILSPIFSLFDSIDLIFDCRICTGLNAEISSGQIDRFTRSFSEHFPIRRVVVSGSSIPASAAEILSPNSEEFIERKEILIYAGAKSLGATDYLFGDYTIISPDYSDVDIPAEQMQGRITAKLIYSFVGQHYFIRGGSLKTKGREQYYDLAAVLCSKEFFRGPEYSPGDNYFYEKSQRKGELCWVNTVIRPAINAHITYALQDLLTDNLL